MKVLLINGSPHEKGTTRRAFDIVCTVLNKNEIETEIITVGKENVSGCVVCGGCAKTGRCVKDDVVNVLIEKIEEADGVIIGTPVYYASMNGTLKAILDRVFYSRKKFTGKVGAAIAVARRAGTTATIDEINKYFMISGMPVVSSKYWNMLFGSNYDQAEQDIEGLETMEMLGENMSYLLKCIDLGKKAGITAPENKYTTRTNFIK